MIPQLASGLADDIIARFRMLGQFTDEAMHRAYRNVLLAYDDEHGERVVRQMLRDNRQPVTDVELDRMLMPTLPTEPVRPTGPITDPTKGRQIMRRAWIDSWCERHGGTEEDFWDAERQLAKDEKRPTLKEQWDRTDRIIAERKKAGLPVDESGLTKMAPVMRGVGPDPFADDEPPIAKPMERKEDPAEKAKRAAIIREAENKAREAMANPVAAFFGETASK